MADAVEVAIKSALRNRALAFAAAQSPALTVELEDTPFTPPPTAILVGGFTVYGKYLRATVLPAKSFARGISFDAHNQHYGIFQVDVFYALGAGATAPDRLAALIVGYFKRGTQVAKDGFTATIMDVPQMDYGRKDDQWWMIPVSIPYQCFARPQA